MHDVLVAIGLVLVIEGALYAAFPAAMKRMMLLAISQPAETLRIAGLGGATIGVAIVWFVRNFVA